MASYKALEKAYLEKNKRIDDKTKVDQDAQAAKIKDMSEDTTGALQQIYLQNERARALQKQSQKAAGITGGASESADIALQANYATNRANALMERDRQISQMEIEKNRAAAQAEIDKSDNLVEMEQGRLAFDQKEQDYALSEKGLSLDQQRLDIDKDSGRLAEDQFTYQQKQDREDDLWEAVRAGVATRAMAEELDWDYETLKQMAANYKEKLNG